MVLFMKAWRLDLVVGCERREIHGGGVREGAKSLYHYGTHGNCMST